MDRPRPGTPSPPHLDRLADQAPVGLAEVDPAGMVVYANERWRRITGLDLEVPFRLSAVEELLPEQERTIIRGQVAAALAAGTDLETTVTFQLPDGTRRIRFYGSPIVTDATAEGTGDGSRTVAGYVCSLTDVTELEEAQAERERSEQRFLDLISSAPVAQAVYALDGTIVEVNEAWADLLGYRADEVVGTPAGDYVHPDDFASLVDAVPDLLRGDQHHLFDERRLRHRDGSQRWASTSVSVERDASGRALLFHSLLIDITERRLAEDALRVSEGRYRDVVEALHDGVLVYGPASLEAVNQAAIDMWGHTFEELADPNTFIEMDPIGLDGKPIPFEEWAGVVAILKGESVRGRVHGYLVPGRGRRWFNVNGAPRRRDGEVIGGVVTFTDITEAMTADEARRESDARFRVLAESLPLGVYHADLRGRIDYANPQWLEISGVAPDVLQDPHTLETIHPDDREQLWRAIGHAFEHREPYHVTYRVIHGDGSVHWLSGHGAHTYAAGSDKPTGIVGSIEDITPLVEAQQATQRLADIVESTSDLVGVVDYATGRLTYLNRASRELLGFVDQEVTEVSIDDVFVDPADSEARQSLLDELEQHDAWTGELAMRAGDGDVRLVWQTIAAERGADGRIARLASVGRDVTERRRLEENLAWQATHDSHTGLPNRALLLDHLELALARAERDGGMAALLFLDLDRFKNVNDTFGHDAGDALLAQAAHRLTDVLRPSDTVARLGGDEFVVLAEHVEDEQHAVAIAQRLANAIDGRPFDVRDQQLDVTVSIGIAVARGREAHPEAMLRDADAAMYRAKDLGRARLELFNEAMRQSAARRNELAEQLAAGIERGDIVVYYQPCVDLTTGRITGVEALARWHHPERGVLSPYEFIALAEDSGLIVGLGLNVLSTACKTAHEWEVRFGADSPTVHVNLSARQLTATNLPTLVEGVLRGTGLAAHKLCLEITESVLMDDAPAVIDTLWALKGIGVSIAIDDFGTGYSSLSYLRKFPVDVLKVDQSFVDGLGPDPEDSAIVAAIVNLAATLELDAIAEGVETPAQVARLRSLGCRTAQGFLFAKPLPPGEVEELFDRTFDVD